VIIVEERLAEAFDQLPLIDGFKPVYDWGNEFNLLATLNVYAKANTSPYPLIYQTSMDEEQDVVLQSCQTRLILIVATVNPQTDLLNKNRWAMSYRNVLFPMAENIQKCILKAGIFLWDGKVRLTKYPNYGSGAENNTTDIWDAIKMEFTNPITISSNCINQIRF